MSVLSTETELAEEQMDVINKPQQRSLRNVPKHPTSKLRQQPTRRSGRGGWAGKKVHFNLDLEWFVTESL